MIEVREVEFIPGTLIKDAILQAYEYAKKHNCKVKFRFNGVELAVYPTYDEADLNMVYNQYLRELKQY